MIALSPIRGLPAIRPGDDLAALIFRALDAQLPPEEGDVLVVCQKVVSKAEGRLVDLRSVKPSPFAREVARTTGKDPRLVEVILGETRRIVRMEGPHLIVETRLGHICANAGVDASNAGDPDRVVLLPEDPDASARRLAERAYRRYGRRLGVIVSDTFGRPWRLGLLDVALGVAGLEPLLDLRGSLDLDGRPLQHTVLAQADALAAAAGLLMHKGDGIPVVLVRGFAYRPARGTARALLRPPERDLFR